MRPLIIHAAWNLVLLLSTPFGHNLYGQTFTTPSMANILDNFSLWLGRTSPLSSTPTPSINFRSYVYAWDNIAHSCRTA